MKKHLSLLVILVLCCTFVLTGCGNYIQKTAKTADTYTLKLAYDDTAHVLSGVETFCFTNKTENTFDCLKFHVYGNAYRNNAENSIVTPMYKTSAYPNGESYGEITFDSVKVDDRAVAFVIEGTDADILSVPLNAELFPGETTTVQMVFSLQLANICHRLGYGANTVNLGNFYPILCNISNGAFQTTPYYNIGDPFVSEVANYSVSLTLPNSYVVASTGTLESATETDAEATYNFTAQAVRDFAFVLSQKYQKISTTVGDTTVNYFYFADTSPEVSLASAVNALKYLSQNVSTYPYATYNVCETDFCYGGMEYPCLSMVTGGSSAYQEAILHETAHQWFYGIVGNNQIENAWMDEGLAEFLTMLMLDKQNVTPLATSIKGALKTFTTYVDVLNNYYQTADTSLRPIANYKNDSEYVCMTYIKGSLLFNTLYEAMGEQKFFKALATYFDTAKMQIASPETLIACFAQTHSEKIKNIFDAFINGTEVIGEFRG